MKWLKSISYKIAYPILQFYWYIVRPETVGVRCIIKNRDKLLLIKHTYGPKFWTTVGGGIKKGETFIAAAIRETKEEVSLDIKNIIACGSILNIAEYKKDRIYVFVAEADTLHFKILDGEIKEAKWCSKNKLPVDTSPLFKQFLSLAENSLQQTTFN